ncbi:MAG: AAA family ATPase [Terriglobales bacterium]
MYIVGRNGSGKSNFLDSLRFIADALNSSLDKALDARGGHAEVLRGSVSV